ncbi:hypothetical protein C7H19_25225, partial [Aphanothece hegewaldii CCALA 016]
MAYELIRFTLADPYLEKLKELIEDQESLHLAAKRLLLSLLGDDQPSITSDASKALEQRLDALEHRLEQSSNLNPNSAIDNAIEQRLAAIEHRLDHLSNTRASEQPSDSPIIVEELEQRLKEIEHRLDHLSNTSNSTGNFTDKGLELRFKYLERKLDDLSNSNSDSLADDSPIVADLEMRLMFLENKLKGVDILDEEEGYIEQSLSERLQAIEENIDQWSLDRQVYDGTSQFILSLERRIDGIAEIIADELKLQASLSVDDDDEPEEKIQH